MRSIKSRLDRLEAKRANEHAPPDAFALFMGFDRRVTLPELLDAASKTTAPPRDDSEPQPNVIDVDAELAKLDAEAAAAGYIDNESSVE